MQCISLAQQPIYGYNQIAFQITQNTCARRPELLIFSNETTYSYELIEDRLIVYGVPYGKQTELHVFEMWDSGQTAGETESQITQTISRGDVLQRLGSFYVAEKYQQLHQIELDLMGFNSAQDFSLGEISVCDAFRELVERDTKAHALRMFVGSPQNADDVQLSVVQQSIFDDLIPGEVRRIVIQILNDSFQPALSLGPTLAFHVVQEFSFILLKEGSSARDTAIDAVVSRTILLLQQNESVLQAHGFKYSYKDLMVRSYLRLLTLQSNQKQTHQEMAYLQARQHVIQRLFGAVRHVELKHVTPLSTAALKLNYYPIRFGGDSAGSVEIEDVWNASQFRQECLRKYPSQQYECDRFLQGAEYSKPFLERFRAEVRQQVEILIARATPLAWVESPFQLKLSEQLSFGKALSAQFNKLAQADAKKISPREAVASIMQLASGECGGNFIASSAAHKACVFGSFLRYVRNNSQLFEACARELGTEQAVNPLAMECVRLFHASSGLCQTIQFKESCIYDQYEPTLQKLRLQDVERELYAVDSSILLVSGFSVYQQRLLANMLQIEIPLQVNSFVINAVKTIGDSQEPPFDDFLIGDFVIDVLNCVIYRLSLNPQKSPFRLALHNSAALSPRYKAWLKKTCTQGPKPYIQLAPLQLPGLAEKPVARRTWDTEFEKALAKIAAEFSLPLDTPEYRVFNFQNRLQNAGEMKVGNHTIRQLIALNATSTMKAIARRQNSDTVVELSERLTYRMDCVLRAADKEYPFFLPAGQSIYNIQKTQRYMEYIARARHQDEQIICRGAVAMEVEKQPNKQSYADILDLEHHAEYILQRKPADQPIERQDSDAASIKLSPFGRILIALLCVTVLVKT